jgi:hypothetical protein
MTTSHSLKRKSHPSGTPGAKMLITAASITAVIGGWAGFTLQQYQAGGSMQATTAAASGEVVMNLPPMPTLIPQPSGSTLTNPQVLAHSEPQIVNPQPFPILRSVQAPPQPVAITRSSR